MQDKIVKERQVTFRQLNNDDFEQLLNLELKLAKLVSPGKTAFAVTNAFVAKINTLPAFTVYGIFRGLELTGMLYGYADHTQDSFHVDGVYHYKQNRKLTKKFIDFVVEQVRVLHAKMTMQTEQEHVTCIFRSLQLKNITTVTKTVVTGIGEL